MAEPAAIQIARSVLNRKERFLNDPSDVGTMAIVQAWEALVGAPEAISRTVSVASMATAVVGAAESVLGVYVIAGGRDTSSLFTLQEVGQRALGTFFVPLDAKTVLQMTWTKQEQGWMWVAKKENEIVGQAETLEALCTQVLNPKTEESK